MTEDRQTLDLCEAWQDLCHTPLADADARRLVRRLRATWSFPGIVHRQHAAPYWANRILYVLALGLDGWPAFALWWDALDAGRYRVGHLFPRLDGSDLEIIRW